MFKKIGLKRALMLVVLAAVLSYTISVAAFYFVYLSGIYETREIPMDIYVSNTPGLNVDSDALHFGKAPPGGVVRRDVVIDNDDVPNQVTIEAFGDIAEWVYVDDNDFIIEAHESRSFTVSVRVPEDAEVPSFRNGTLRIIFRMI